MLIAVGGLVVFCGFWWVWYLVVWVCCGFCGVFEVFGGVGMYGFKGL